ncbi:MAG: SdrD B-like domain-containing protein, partial [Burkholderiaceae bacterium]
QGYVYLDLAPANGKRDAAEQGIAGVTVTVSGTDFLGSTVTRPVQTDSSGSYLVNALAPGDYQIDETQPTNVGDGLEALGSVGNLPRGIANPGGVNDRFGGIALVSEETGVNYDFGEGGGQLGGFVYVDSNNDGVRQPGETGIAGVTLTLTGRSQSGNPVNLTATTDENGHYVFSNLPSADAAGYTIRETQPVAWGDGLDSVGTLDGAASGTAGNDVINAIAYRGGLGENYNFGERGATLEGTVYVDGNRNGLRDAGEPPIPGTTVTVSGTDANGKPLSRTAVTGPDGKYRFVDLPAPGTGGYTLDETQPSGFEQGIAVPGNLGGSAQGPDRITFTFPPGANASGYDFNERSDVPGSLTGSVWLDPNHNRVRDGGEIGGDGWTVELMRCLDGGTTCTETALVPVASTTTDANGNYRFDNLPPGEYRIRFRTPEGRVVGGVWPTDPSENAPGGAHPTPAPGDPRLTIRVRVTPGANIIKQDLPYEPGGVVYDSSNGQPIPGAVVTLVGPPGFDPSVHLLSGQGSITTGPNGRYDFYLLPGAPAGSYRIEIVPPGGYQPSTLYPPAPGALGTQFCTASPGGPTPAQSNPCVISPGAQLVVGAGYYLAYNAPAGGGQHVVANNIPLDPLVGAIIELRKTTPKLTVKKGELLPYTITARNTRGSALTNVAIVDTLPPGFRYVQGSMTVRLQPGGVALPVIPLISGRQITVNAQNFAPNEIKEYVLVAGVGTGVGEGEYVNQAIASQGIGGRLLSNLASAAVRVVPDVLFDCTDVIGKVYDDKNANGYQDEGEPGLPNVRIATVNGLLVTTDAEGRYHIACAAVPQEGTGSNLVLKLDARTLPSGYRTTSENPAAERATRGKALKINFGATVHRVVRLELSTGAFDSGVSELKSNFAADVERT